MKFSKYLDESLKRGNIRQRIGQNIPHGLKRRGQINKNLTHYRPIIHSGTAEEVRMMNDSGRSVHPCDILDV
jgi:hypothetical protein